MHPPHPSSTGAHCIAAKWGCVSGASITMPELLWLRFDPGSLNWAGIAMLATWTMTLFIQRSEHHDTQKILPTRAMRRNKR
jgi:hypothetical protein